MTSEVVKQSVNPRLHIALWGGAAALLCVPLLGMISTDEVNWGPGDFVVMCGLLALLCAGIELALRVGRNRMARIAGVAIALMVFLAIWAELAVGIFD